MNLKQFFQIGFKGRELRQYAQEYLSTYKKLVESNIPTNDRSKFEFYLGYPYYVEGVNSIKGGTAVIFIPSQFQRITAKTIEEKIEWYVIPETRGTPPFVFNKGNMWFYDSTIIGGFISLGETGILYYKKDKKFAIAKGCSKSICWSKETARNDALSEFLMIARNIILEDAELKKIEGRVKLVSIAEKIINREELGYYTNNREFWLKDNEEYLELTEQFGIKKEVANNLLNEIRKELSRPKLYELILSRIKNIVIDNLIWIVLIIFLLFIGWLIMKKPIREFPWYEIIK